MKSYELMLIIKPNLKEEAKKVLDGIKALVEKVGGKIKKEDLWGKRRLAYKIESFTEGEYVLIDFELEPKEVKKFEEKLRLEEGLIRYLITVKT